MNEAQFDTVIVGGGPGGYVAALRSAQLGMKTALIEKEKLGGVCLNWGCIPTKALLHSAGVLREIRQARHLGVDIEGTVSPNLNSMVKRSRDIAAKLTGGIEHLLKKSGVSVLNGHAHLQGDGRLTVDGVQDSWTVKASHIVLATGARPRILPSLPAPDARTVWTYRDALTATSAPKRLLIVGAGAIGVEFASFYGAIGSQVTIVESAGRILPIEDVDVSEAVAQGLKRDGTTILVGTSVDSAKQNGHAWRVETSGINRSTFDVDVILLATGIVGNVEGIGLEHTAAKIENGHVAVDSLCRTDEPGLFAIGDVAGPPWLAHKASHEGVMVAEYIAGLHPHPIDPKRIPSCTYSHPQAASVGLTESQAAEAGRKTKVGKFPLAANGKAVAMDNASGFVKVIFDGQSGELLGAHLVGHEVTELIHGFTIGQILETSDEELIANVFPHPTVSEAIHEAVLAAQGRALHI